MKKPVIDHVDFEYNGENINVRINMYSEERNVVIFDYKGVTVQKSYSDEINWWSVCDGVCKMIDKIGADTYKEYQKLKSEVSTLTFNKLIVGDSVYKYYYDDSIRFGDLIYYTMSIKMSDGTVLDGTAFSTYFYDEERRSKKKTFDNLKRRVLNYYKEKNVLPDEKYLDKQATERYQEIQKWIKENIG